jgi:hypothetical protein
MRSLVRVAVSSQAKSPSGFQLMGFFASGLFSEIYVT